VLTGLAAASAPLRCGKRMSRILKAASREVRRAAPARNRRQALTWLDRRRAQRPLRQLGCRPHCASALVSPQRCLVGARPTSVGPGGWGPLPHRRPPRRPPTAPPHPSPSVLRIGRSAESLLVNAVAAIAACAPTSLRQADWFNTRGHSPRAANTSSLAHQDFAYGKA